jgi:hypothetical protein
VEHAQAAARPAEELGAALEALAVERKLAERAERRSSVIWPISGGGALGRCWAGRSELKGGSPPGRRSMRVAAQHTHNAGRRAAHAREKSR